MTAVYRDVQRNDSYRRSDETNLDDVYAAGDCVMVKNRLTGKRQWSPMGSSANLEGRTLHRYLPERRSLVSEILGTGVVKLPVQNEPEEQD